ncbi:MAG: hypothetical protein IPN68_10975 [Bacteroidetes bacterium]|nr:hypothetical protein [Bacteroidota bacterium]
MKKEFLLSLILGILIISANAAALQKSSLTGSWKCVANDVPDEYKNSIISITEKEGKLEGSVKFENGTMVNLNYVKQNDKEVTMSIYVEGYEVVIKGKLEGSKITGTADTPDGPVTLTATKSEKKK